jgi:hypothetical protein
MDLSFSGRDDSSLKILASRGSAKEGLSLSAEFTVENTVGLEFRDIVNEVVLNLESSRASNMRIFNIEPEQYQFTCIMPVFPISLDAGKVWDNVFTLKISS